MFLPVALIWEYLPLPCHHKYNQISFSWTDSDLICITLYKSYYINYIQQEQWWHSRKIPLYSSWFLSLLHAWEHKWAGDVILSVFLCFINIRGDTGTTSLLCISGGLLTLILNFIMVASSEWWLRSLLFKYFSWLCKNESLPARKSAVWCR